MADPAVSSTGVIIGLPTPLTFPATAGDVITSVRDQGPDPVYDTAGAPQPDTDGRFLRVQTLYRWLSNGLRDITRRTNWFVEDWYAVPSIDKQRIYSIDAKWHNLEAAFANRRRCTFVNEPLTIFPSAAVSQPLTWGIHARKGPLEVFYWPAPDLTDPAPTLTSALNATDDTIPLSATTGFLPFGWLRIDTELIQYEVVNPTNVQVTRRGASGSRATTHTSGTVVYHCSLVVKGWRTPQPVTQASDFLEVPLAFVSPLETYLLSKYREAEQDRQEAQSLWSQYLEECNAILTDPRWQGIMDSTFQVAAYGSGGYGGWYGGGPFGVIIP